MLPTFLAEQTLVSIDLMLADRPIRLAEEGITDVLARAANPARESDPVDRRRHAGPPGPSRHRPRCPRPPPADPPRAGAPLARPEPAGPETTAFPAADQPCCQP
jgi:hypothetical protein